MSGDLVSPRGASTLQGIRDRDDGVRPRLQFDLYFGAPTSIGTASLVIARDLLPATLADSAIGDDLHGTV